MILSAFRSLAPLLLATALGAWPHGAGAQEPGSGGACPAGHPRAEARVKSFFTGSSTKPDRVRFGIPSSLVAEVRLLTDSDGGRVCRRLNEALGPSRYMEADWARGFYRAGEFYFVSFAYAPPSGDIRLGPTPLIVLDRDLNLLEVIAS